MTSERKCRCNCMGIAVRGVACEQSAQATLALEVAPMKWLEGLFQSCDECETTRCLETQLLSEMVSMVLLEFVLVLSLCHALGAVLLFSFAVNAVSCLQRE